MFILFWIMASAALITAIILVLRNILKPFENIHEKESGKPFIVSEYFDRMEKASIDIIKNQPEAEYDFILWWGLDGLKLLEDGTTKWIERGKRKETLSAGGTGGVGRFVPMTTGAFYGQVPPYPFIYGAQQFRQMHPYYQMQSQVTQIKLQTANQKQNAMIM